MAAARTEGFVYEMFLSNRVGQMVEQSLKHHEDARRPTRKPLNKLAQIFKFHTFQFLSTKNNSTCSMYVQYEYHTLVRTRGYELSRTYMRDVINPRVDKPPRRPSWNILVNTDHKHQNTTSTNHPTYFCKPFSLKLCTRV